VAELFWDPNLRYRQRVRVDPAVLADYAAAGRPTRRSTATSRRPVDRTAAGPPSGTYTLSDPGQGVGQGVGRRGGGADDLPPADKVEAEVRLAEGLHDVRVHYFGQAVKPAVRLGWSFPGLFADEPIAPQYFARDVRVGAEHVAAAGARPAGRRC
jgi:hypothetical protein